MLAAVGLCFHACRPAGVQACGLLGLGQLVRVPLDWIRLVFLETSSMDGPESVSVRGRE